MNPTQEETRWELGSGGSQGSPPAGDPGYPKPRAQERVKVTPFPILIPIFDPQSTPGSEITRPGRKEAIQPAASVSPKAVPVIRFSQNQFRLMSKPSQFSGVRSQMSPEPPPRLSLARGTHTHVCTHTCVHTHTHTHGSLTLSPFNQRWPNPPSELFFIFQPGQGLFRTHIFANSSRCPRPQGGYGL